MRQTTFEELLESCYHLSRSMSVQTDKSLNTQGSTTSPKGKCCPITLRPWEDFPIVRQCAFNEVYNILHPLNNTSPRLFSPLLHIEELARTMPSRKIAISTSTINSHRNPKPIHADQICVYKNENDQMDLLFIVEYKAPHKLTKEVLRA